MDVQVTKVGGGTLCFAWFSKNIQYGFSKIVGSYIHPMVKHHGDEEMGAKFASETGIVGFFPRRGQDGSTAMKIDPKDSTCKWNWYGCIFELDDDEDIHDRAKKIARQFMNFTGNKALSGMEKKEEYVVRCVYSDNLVPLVNMILDKDAAKILKMCFGNEDDDESTKEELMMDDELMTSFFGSPEDGHEYLETMDEDEWDNLLVE